MNKDIVVLNKSWSPISLVSFKVGISLLFKINQDGSPKANIVDIKTYQMFSWQEWITLKPCEDEDIIITPKYKLIRPKIVALTNFNGTSKRKVLFSRKNIFVRDNYSCLYCGQKTQEMTIDHINPTSKGGLTNWENCVSACAQCNKRKGSKSLDKCKMKLIVQPYEPTWSQIIKKHISTINLDNFLN